MNLRHVAFVAIACSGALLPLLSAERGPGTILSEAEASQLIGGAGCEDWDPATCQGTKNGCATNTQWKARTNGPTRGKNPQNSVCGSQNCGSVDQIDKCDAM